MARFFNHGNRLGGSFGRDVDLGLLHPATQHRFDILQGLGRSALEHSFTDEPRHIHRRAGDQQHPLGGFNGRGRQLTFRMGRINDFDTGAPTLTLGRCIKQTSAQHTGDHAVRAGRNNG